MEDFEYRDGELFCEEVPLREIAEGVGTPCYVYSSSSLTRQFRAFDEAFRDLPHLICFAMKANENLAVLKLFANLGGGVDIVSGGELFRALEAGVPPERIVFAGVGKSTEEIIMALKRGILMFNVESPEELDEINHVAKNFGRKAPVALRVNPDVDPETHPYISTGLRKSKFGMDISIALEEYRRATGMEFVEVLGLHSHIGSQITSIGPFADAVDKTLALVGRLREVGVTIRYLNLGGGLGIAYQSETPPGPAELAETLVPRLRQMDLTLLLEPGRHLVGNAGVLLSKVLYRKETPVKRFIVADAAMNDLLRPSLYEAYHEVRPLSATSPRPALQKADLVGPICESGDFLALDRDLPDLKAGDLFAVMSAGAYGFSMSSNYNARPRVPEVLVKGGEHFVVRKRETYHDLIRGEKIPPFLTNGQGEGRS